MIKLKQLLLENRDLTSDEFADMIQNAYIAIFDVDKELVQIVQKSRLGSPSFLHNYFSVNISLKYRFRKFVIYHKIYHYVFPPSEFKNLSKSEWDNAIKIAHNSPYSPITKDLLKKSNPLVVLKARIHEYSSDKYDYFDSMEIGYEEAHNVLDLLTKVKKTIDSQGNDGGDESNVPSPDVPNPEMAMV